MKERLVIKNFGPIKSVDLELGKMTILIGEQATGKSTIAKVLAVCRYFSFITTIEQTNITSSFGSGLRAWGLDGMTNLNSQIEYYCNDYDLIVNYQPWNIRMLEDSGDRDINAKVFSPKLTAKSERFMGLLEDLKNIESISVMSQIPPSFFQKNVINVMDNPFFFPTERGLQSIFSLGKSSIQNISDSLYNQFAKMDMFAKSFPNETDIIPLNLTYKNINGQGFIKNERQIEFSSLYNGASGYKSTIPIILTIKHYSENRKKSKTFIVEEPELNLFPKAQKKLIEFFVENVNENGHSFLLPTHSPYVLSALNDLLMAYKKGQKNPEEVKKVVKKEYWLNPEELSVYELKDGKATSIVDRKLNLISENILDDVSDEMNDEFDMLLDIES
ncbi:AAA family ATPase [Flavobacterium sp. DGU11]|uniref:AAA family ATPase n=1 Tax=Flavobacterium arundinis TaxID=3139143 RepID=A0ABU9HYA3_9FLAO